ncbi:uncharacterized protein LOC108675898 isoform X2 [Hyalella azteca]|uniref:Uncharacterized protein LOC108675898 isoform X2 n=1 Tax=Hyalella azteca TaxID=294128 RepID=A0A979FKP1_HYAAZ|nr:uncharacterized protein LOC108675898 isoform X2 [Hyalella azteca]
MSDAYKSLPRAIASTIPRRPNFRDSWCEKQPTSASEISSHFIDEDCQNIEKDAVKRKSAFFQSISDKREEEAMKARRETGQVRKVARIFERNSCSEVNFTARESNLKTSDDMEIIKYKVKYPYWQGSRVKSHRHTVSNFPKWDAISQEGLNPNLLDPKNSSFSDEIRAKVGRVDFIKRRLQELHKTNTSPVHSSSAFNEENGKENFEVPELVERSHSSIKPPVSRRTIFNEVRPPVVHPATNGGEKYDAVERSQLKRRESAGEVELDLAGGQPAPETTHVFSVKSELVRSGCVVTQLRREDSDEHSSTFSDDDQEASDASTCTVIDTKNDFNSKNFVRNANVTMVGSVDSCAPHDYIRGHGTDNQDMELLANSDLIPESENSIKVPTQPRIVAAALKSYRDIPEEIFDSLPESSVDPVPDDSVAAVTVPATKDDIVETNEEASPRQVQDWVVMQEGRKALFESSILSPRWTGTQDDAESSDGSSLSGVSDPTHAGLMQTSLTSRVVGRNFALKLDCPTLSYFRSEESSNYNEESPHVESPLSVCTDSNDHNTNSDVCSHGEELSDTERQLRKAGVYFRFPPTASSQAARKVTPATPSTLNDHEKEVSDALRNLDSTLDNYCSSSGSSSSDNGGSPINLSHTNETRVTARYKQEDSRPVIGHDISSNNRRSFVEEFDIDRIKSSRWNDRVSDASKATAHSRATASTVDRCQSDRESATGRSETSASLSVTDRERHHRGISIGYSSVDHRSKVNGNDTKKVNEEKPVLVKQTSSGSVMSVKTINANHSKSVLRPNCRSDGPVVTIEPYCERNSSIIVDNVNSKRKSVNDIRNNFHNTIDLEGNLNRQTIMEPLNLIEEVYVPESSVAMRSFFPSMEFSSRSSVNRNKVQNKPVDCEKSEKLHGRSGDSDSGHGSGATSPCGTLTDPPSPPPTPPDTRPSRLPSHGHGDEISINNCSPVRNEEEVLVSVPVFESASNKHVSIVNTASNDPMAARDSPLRSDLQSSPDGSSPLNVDSAVVSPNNVQLGEVTVTSAQPESNHFVVVAIDFGTTYSGYAFSFTRDPDNVHMMKKWEGGDPGVQNQKTPTIVLLDPERRFHSLGFTARDSYHDLDPKEANKWFYFDKFKMELHDDRSLSRDSLLSAANGQQVPAMEIFSHALGYFRDHALRELSDLAGGALVTEHDVRWVITVPAIWSHPAKQFMRTAAYMAGLADPNSPEQLLIALEPEAAAIYCRKLRRHQLVSGNNPVLRHTHSPYTRPVSSPSGSWPHHYRANNSAECRSDPTEANESGVKKGVSPRPYSTINASAYKKTMADSFQEPDDVLDISENTVYMVVDCGGGTVDITVHQMTDTKAGHLKELHKATGGPYGSTGVDKEFEKLLEKIFTAEFMTAFKQQRPAAFVDLMVAFESRKRNASPHRSNPLNIALPFSFIDMFKKFRGKDVESAVRKHGTGLGVQWSSQGMLRVSQETMRGLFQDTLDNIQQSIESVLSLLEREASTGNSSALQYLFLVGGFSESELLQQHIRDAFSHRVTVVIPQGMGLAILRGAVQFGLDPAVVTVRRSRLTYGVGVLNRFQDGVHPAEKRVFAAGADWCADVLDVFVRVDESVAVGDVVSRSYTPATLGQSTVVLHLYATHETKAMHFVSDAGVERVGTLLLDLKDTWEKPSTDEEFQSPDARPAKVCCCSRRDEAFHGDGTDAGNCSVCGSFSSKSETRKSKNISTSQISSARREISVHLKFGGTEVKASAVDHVTGKCVRASFDFLSL